MDKQVDAGDGDKVFRHRIIVRWADCDPARIAYTGRIPYFALEAIDAWWGEHTGDDWYSMNVDHDRGAPFVHLSVDFRSPVTPRHLLELEVRLLKLGESSIRFSVMGFQDGVLCFEGQFVQVYVEADAHRKTSIPDEMRRKLLGLVVT
jgi:acyl-CoA thioesterase FadM